MAKNDSHLSTGGVDESEPTRQHHRLARGEKVSGQTNPNGAETGSRDKKVKPSSY